MLIWKIRSDQNNYRRARDGAARSVFFHPSADSRGFSLVEILVTLAIFSVLMTGIFTAYLVQLGHSTREYKIAESEVELGIAKEILQRDIQLGGYGLAFDYGGSSFAPRAVAVEDGDSGPDQLILMGTALGGLNRASQSWTYMDATTPTFGVWADNREQLRPDDRVILMEPSSNRLQTQSDGTQEMWLFKYDPANAIPGLRLTSLPAGTGGTAGIPYASADVGTLVYGLYDAAQSANDDDGNTKPYYTARYYLGGTSPAGCAPGSQSLLRGESVTSEAPAGDPLLACVLDFQVALGLDTDEDGELDVWDDGGTAAAGYTADNLKKRLKQVKAYFLVQSGSRDSEYTNPLTTIRVGEGTDIGRDVVLTAAQRQYRWKLVTMSALPRNLR